MNQKFTHLFFTVFAFGAMLVFSAQAQEHSPVTDPTEVEIRELNSHPELNLNEDKTLLLESSEHQQRPHGAVVNRETVVAKPAKPKSEKVVEKQEEEDALSFNFLYYIISKFKYSDIVD